jgi:transposase
LDKEEVINILFPLLIKGEQVEDVARICNVSKLYVTNTLKCVGRFKSWCLENAFSSKLEEVKIARPELFKKKVVHKKEHNHTARKNETQIVEFLRENSNTSIEEICQQFDISSSTAYRITRAYGYKTRMKKEIQRQRSQKQPSTKLEIANSIIRDLQKVGIDIQHIDSYENILAEMIIHLRNIPLSKEKWNEILKKLA